MLETAVRDRLMSEVEQLDKRVQTAADLSELIAKKALPQAPVTGFVVPSGLRPTGGESAAGAFTQEIDEVIALVLVLRTAGDVTGTKGLVKLDPLLLAVIEALSGWAPDEEDAAEAYPVTGVFRLLRGQVVRVDAGVIFYQLEFACSWQLRIFHDPQA